MFGQDHKGYFKLIPENCTDDKVIYISLVGSSGFPDVEINTKLIDFGYTVWKGRNVKSLEIKNKGTVSAILNFSSKNKALSIEEVDEENHIVIEPESIKKVHVVYIPSKMELLNVNGVFSYVKYKSDNILVNFRATVCQPKLVIDPPDFYSKIDFGICHKNKIYEKRFTISNEGTVDLKYKINFDFESFSNNNNNNNNNNNINNNNNNNTKSQNKMK